MAVKFQCHPMSTSVVVKERLLSQKHHLVAIQYSIFMLLLLINVSLEVQSKCKNSAGDPNIPVNWILEEKIMSLCPSYRAPSRACGCGEKPLSDRL